jgi:urea transporter, Yersinia type
MDANDNGKIKIFPKVLSLDFIKIIFRGSGQVMFQNNAWTGFLFLCGIFWGSYETGTPAVAWGALVAVVVSTLTGRILRLPDEEGVNGLWGFNGILVGCAFPTFLGNTVLMWIALILCTMLSTWVRTGFNNIMAPWKTNSFTFPFVFTSWLFLLAARLLKGLPDSYMSSPELVNTFSTTLSLKFVDLVIYWLKGIAQVFLINSWVTGVCFLVALFISSRWATLWAAVGSAVALFVVILFQGSGSDISQGLYGFSAVLTAIALGCTFYKVNIRSAIWALLGIAVTVFIQAGMNALFLPLGLPTLTGPFCLATWLFLFPLIRFDEHRPDHSNWHKKKKKE